MAYSLKKKAESIILKYEKQFRILTGMIFILIVSSICHFAFSRLGFTPYEDGFILAGSRRILEGQIPHRDFISIRPTGSYFFHAPFLIFSGDYIFWVSRYFVWIQFATISWIWTILIFKFFDISLGWVYKFSIALIAFFFNVHNYAIMAWHTIDGMFFISIGLMLCHNNNTYRKIFGYLGQPLYANKTFY